MFKLNPNPTFEAKISIVAPGGDTQELVLTFKHKTRDDLQKFNELMISLNSSGDYQKARAMLFDLVDGWNVDQEFNKKNFEALLNNFARAEGLIYAKYIDELLVAREGN